MSGRLTGRGPRVRGRTFPGSALSRVLGGVTSGVLMAAGAGPAAAQEVAQDEVEVFVRLQTPAVAEINARSLEANGRLASAEDQRAQAARIDAEQAAFRPQLRSAGATELSRMRVGANGIRMRVPASAIETLKSMPGVASVGRVTEHFMDNADGVPWVGALAVAERLGVRGEGIRIGVIDSGVDYLHANFGGPGTVAAYTANNKNVVEPGTFPTAKVVGGFDFAGPVYNPGTVNNTPQPDPDPLDGNGHGSHVAGSATGLGVPGRIHAGVAPAAKLYALKVFNDSSGSTLLTSLAIEWAMDPNSDGDMSDHLDVINLSLGSNYGELADPSSIAIENAVAAGVIVVTSAGNSSNLPYVTSSPGVAHSAISTAANVPGNRVHARVTVNAPASVAGVKFNEEGNGTVRVAAAGPIADTVVLADPLLGCTALANAAAVSGNIALIQRGVCSFAQKLAVAQAAGARAMVLFNNVDGDPIVAGLAGVVHTIPVVMVSLADGGAMAAAATTAATSPLTATLDTGLDPTKDDRIVSFSSRGPGHGGSTFKPDIAAPGIGIISTGVGTGDGPAPNQGTSMASPYVTGSAALLRQLHPNMPIHGIKALLQNSTAPANASGDTSLARSGVGALRVDRAAALTSFASPGGISFGRLNPTSTVNVSETVYLRNLAGRSRTFTATHVPRATYPGVEVQCPQPVSVGRHGEKTFKLRLRFDPRAAPAAGIFDNASISQREVDGWCVLSDGTDSLRVGYIAVVDSASGMVLAPGGGSFGVDVFNKGPALGVAEGFALVGSGGTGADNTYSSIAHLGVRRGDPAVFGEQVIEFGLAVEHVVEHPYNLDVDLFLDIDRNGTDDVRLRGRDWTDVQPSPPAVLGTYLTTQQPVPAGANPGLDWLVTTWDFNDRVLILPYTLQASGGLVPDSFNYRLEVQDGQGNTDVQTGSVDLNALPAADLNSFVLAQGERVHVDTVGPAGRVLWLFPNNHDWVQDWTVWTSPGGFH